MSVGTLQDEIDYVVFTEALPEEDGPHRMAIAVEGMEAGNSPTPPRTEQRLIP